MKCAQTTTLMAVTLLFALAGCRPNHPPAPDLVVATIDGPEYAVREHRGEVILLNFWATWCRPCVEEMPFLQALHDELGTTGLSIVGISIDTADLSDIRAFTDEMGITYTIAHDSGPAQEAFGGLWAVPTTVLIDRRGRLRQVIVGAFDPAILRNTVAELVRA